MPEGKAADRARIEGSPAPLGWIVRENHRPQGLLDLGADGALCAQASLAKGIREPFRIPGLKLHNVELKDVAMRQIFSMQESNFHIEKNAVNSVDFK